MNTRIWYRFSDEEGSFKQSKPIILTGQFSDNGKEDLARALFNGKAFIPEQIGIEPLRPAELESSQIWHTLDVANASPTVEKDCGISCEEFIERVQNVVWNPSQVSRKLHQSKMG